VRNLKADKFTPSAVSATGRLANYGIEPYDRLTKIVKLLEFSGRAPLAAMIEACG
jgi:hypothetical protein